MDNATYDDLNNLYKDMAAQARKIQRLAEICEEQAERIAKLEQKLSAIEEANVSLYHGGR